MMRPLLFVQAMVAALSAFRQSAATDAMLVREVRVEGAPGLVFYDRGGLTFSNGIVRASSNARSRMRRSKLRSHRAAAHRRRAQR